VADGVTGMLTGPPSQWPQASYSYKPPTGGTLRPDDPTGWSDIIPTDGIATDTWKIADVANPRTYRLSTGNIPALVSPRASAVLTARDLGYLSLEVEYERPVLQWDWEGPTMTTRDQVWLCPAFEPSSEDLLQNRRFEGLDGVTIEVSFYWPPYPKGPTAGYTAPLARWVETKIAGYTSEPIELRGEYSQTYRPEHHNFAEHFLFEPQVEQGLSPATLAELKAKDIRYIHVLNGLDTSAITTYGYDAEGL
jgi:hypothetical protein